MSEYDPIAAAEEEFRPIDLEWSFEDYANAIMRDDKLRITDDPPLRYRTSNATWKTEDRDHIYRHNLVKYIYYPPGEIPRPMYFLRVEESLSNTRIIGLCYVPFHNKVDETNEQNQAIVSSKTPHELYEAMRTYLQTAKVKVDPAETDLAIQNKFDEMVYDFFSTHELFEAGFRALEDKTDFVAPSRLTNQILAFDIDLRKVEDVLLRQERVFRHDQIEWLIHRAISGPNPPQQ